MSSAAVPHFALPFRVDASGSAAVVEQDSLTDVAQCVVVLASTPRGSRLDLLDYGLTDPTFRVGFDRPEFVSQLAKYEPRAYTTVTATPAAMDSLQLEVDVVVRLAAGGLA